MADEENTVMVVEMNGNGNGDSNGYMEEDEEEELASPPMDTNGHDRDLNNSGVETESNCSLEDAAARIESALRKNLKLDECNGITKLSQPKKTDVTKLPGYQTIPPDCPLWRRDLIERKNKQLEEDAKQEVAYMRAEEDKWKNVPEWKRSLIIEKERKKMEELGPTEVNRLRQEEELRRLQAMPEWKRNLLMKKKTEGM